MTNNTRMPNPKAPNLRPSRIAAPRVQGAGQPVDNSLPVNRERIHTAGGAARLKPGQRKKAAVKLPPMSKSNPFR